MPTNLNSPPLIRRGDKFALMAIRAHCADIPHTLKLADSVFATTTAPIGFIGDWIKWLGTIRADEFERSHVFIEITVPSEKPHVADDENNRLLNSLWWVLVGLSLSARIAFDSPDILIGGEAGVDAKVHYISNFESAVPRIGVDADPITESVLKSAWQIAQYLEQWHKTGRAWRINAVIKTYMNARSLMDIPEQIHALCRCIEGFLLPDIGATRKQFKSRTELFIGPGKHDLIGQIYDVRSKVEHLNYEYLIAKAEREERLELVRQNAVIEGLARHCLNHLLCTQRLWKHFRTDDALSTFWKLEEIDRRALWGEPISIDKLIEGFEGRWISDQALGL